jgi:ribosomal protein S18 acetylase RimI-like enzyme
MIRIATLKDIDKLLEITKACGIHMIGKNIYQWNEFYPNKNAFLKDLERNELYVLELNNELIGCICVSTFMDEEYETISWLSETKNNIYIHRLAIHPNYQGKGHAQKLMAFAEDFAKKNHSQSVRLDTFSKNQRNVTFYEHRGYKRLGNIYFPKQSDYPFYCYELVL